MTIDFINGEQSEHKANDFTLMMLIFKDEN